MRLARRRVPVILQVANSDCGPAALAMVLRGFGRRTPVARVREVLDAGRDGVSALDLRDAARGFGLTCRAFDLSAARTDPGVLRGLPLPLIAHWEGDHFVVVEWVGPGAVRVVDPAVGRMTLPYRTAQAALTGVVLLFEAAPARGRRPDSVRGERPAPARGERPAPVRGERARPAHREAPARRKRVGPAAVRGGPAGPGPARALLLPVILRHRAMLATVALASLLLVVAGLVVPLATARIVDALAGSTRPGGAWLTAIAGLALATGLLTLLRSVTVVVLQRRLGRDITGSTVGWLFGAAYRYFERRDNGDLIARVRSATSIPQVLTSSLVGTVLDAALAVGYLGVVAAFAPTVALAAAGLMAAQLLLTIALIGGTRNLQREELLASAQQTSRLVDAVTGSASIRAAGADSWVLDRWRDSYERELTAAYRRSRLSSVAQALLAVVSAAAPLLLLYVAARAGGAVGGTSGGVGPAGAAVGLAALAGAAVTPAGGLALGLFSLAQLGPLLDRLADVRDAPIEQETPKPAAPRLRGRVELVDVSFRYDRRSPEAVHGLSVVIEPGMKVGIVGASGSGKSTVGKLLTGLHSPTAGVVRFDGYDLREVDLTSVRRQLGVVLQEPFLTAGTVREALTLGHPEATDEEVERAARLAEIHDEILALPMGYQTRLGDGGRGLSGGQRQRVALARALLGEPAVLILDEATSALDPRTEARVEANLRGLPMTRIVVAHRTSTVADADLVLVMSGGRVLRRGTPHVIDGIPFPVRGCRDGQPVMVR